MRQLARIDCRLLAATLAVLAITPAAFSVDYPYTGIVAGDDVYVRCGPDANWYPVMKLSRGQQVTVQGETYGWLKITPPTGSFSYIDKQYVQRQDSGGIVTGDRVFVRTGSLLTNDRSAAQLKLDRGQQVTIIGEDGGFYKIQPPAGASLYISARYVRPEGEAGDILAQAPQPGAATQPGAGIIVRESHPPVAPARPGAVPTTGPAPRNWQHELDALEALAKLEETKPAADRDWAGLLIRYKVLAEQSTDAAVRAIAQARVEHLTHFVAARKAWDAVLRADAIVQQEMELAKRPLPEVATTQPPRGFDAKGVLKTSWVFTGLNTPKLYRLVNPATDTAVAYVQQTPELADKLESLLGRYVGVRAAQQQYRPDWNVNLIVPAAVEPTEGEPTPATRPLEAPPTPATEPVEDE